MLPRVHGSGLFTRGETQVLSSLALGTTKEAQRIDGLGIETSKRYIHHYNFPPFSVGEIGFMRGPKRRDIGHGALAERALLPMIPAEDEFPYTLRIVSETLESQRVVLDGVGLRLDPRAPRRRRADRAPRGGHRDGPHQGGRRLHRPQRHPGRRGPPRRHGLQGRRHREGHQRPPDGHQDHRRQLRHPARRARAGEEGPRAHPRDHGRGASTRPRTELSAWAPRITAIKIDPDRIGTVIGKGGETIRGLEADYEVEISIEDDGTVKVYGVDGQKADAAIEQIRAMTKDVEVGDTYLGAKVVKTTTFGAFVELTKGVDGLLHISNLGRGRVEKVEDVVNRGDVVDVTVVEVDKARGRIGLRIVGMEDVDGGGGDNGAEGAADGDDDGKPRRRRRRLTVPE